MPVIILQYNAASSVLIATLGIGLFSEVSSFKQKLAIGPDTLTVGTLLTAGRYGYFTSTGSNSNTAASIGRGASGSASAFGYADLYAYSTDTYTARANITSAFCAGAATSIESTAYYYGGGAAGGDNTTKKYVYSTDTYTNNISSAATSGSSMQGGAGGNLTLAIYSLGYSSADTTATNKIVYSTEVSTIGSALATGQHKTAGIASTTAAYFCGAVVNTTKNDKYIFSSGITSSATSLHTGVNCASGISAPSAGYIVGGNISSKVQKITFATDAWTTTSNLAGNTAEAFGGCSNIHAGALGSTLLTVAGLGLIGEAGANKSIYQFTTDTLAASSTVITSERQRGTLVATAGSSVQAFTSGGVGASTVVFNDLYEYSSDTFTAQADLTSATSHSNALGIEAAVYIFSGYVAGSNISAIKKFNFVSYTLSTIGTTVITASRQGSGAGNTTLGIIADGYTTGNVASTEKFTYSTEAIVSGTSLNTSAYGRGAFACPTAVIFAGAAGGATAATSVQKYVMATNTVSTETSLSAGHTSAGSFGSYSIGYIVGGGDTNYGRVDKYTWSSGTWVSTIAAGIPVDDIAGGTSNVHGGLTGIPVTRILYDSTPDAGYGLISEAGPASGANSKQKYSFANDTVVSTSSVIAAQRTLTGTASNAQFAFISGGWTTGQIANNDLYSFPDDSFTVATALATATSHMSGAGTWDKGYFFAGYTGSNINATKTYTYASATQSTGAAIIVASRQGTATGNTTNAIIADGYGPTNTTENFNYAGNSRVAGALLGTSDYGRGSFASPTQVIITGGAANGTATQVYTIASNTVASATAISTGHSNASSFGSQTVGVIAGGNNASAQKYTWASGTWSSIATSGISARSQQGGASTVHSGLTTSPISAALLYYGVGVVYETSSNKLLYSFSNNTYTNSTNVLAATRQFTFASTASNSTLAISAGRGAGANEKTFVDIYVYSTDTVYNGNVLATGFGQSSSAGNAVNGYYFGGSQSNVAIATVRKVVFSTKVISSPSTLQDAGFQTAAAGNSTVAIIQTGSSAGATNKYTYASDTCASSSGIVSTGTGEYGKAAFSSLSKVAFCGGNNSGNTYFVYTVAADTVVSSSDATVGASNPSSMGNQSFGILVGGVSNTTSRNYRWSSGTWVTGQSIGTGTAQTGGTSNCHSGL